MKDTEKSTVNRKYESESSQFSWEESCAKGSPSFMKSARPWNYETESFQIKEGNPQKDVAKVN